MCSALCGLRAPPSGDDKTAALTYKKEEQLNIYSFINLSIFYVAYHTEGCGKPAV